MISRGALYFIWGDLERLLERSIASLKKHHPDLPIHIERLPDESTYLDKVRMFEVSPFETTAYLDADTVILGNLDYAFEQAEQFGIACCVNESPWARRYDGLRDRGDMVEYNAGIVFFDKVKSKPVFDAWAACCYTLNSSSRFHTPEGIKRQLCNDQAGMAKAIEDTGFNPKVLPHNWNFRPFWQRSYVGPLKIWHDYAEPPEHLVKHSEKNQDAVIFDTIYLSDTQEDPAPVEGKKLNVACAMSTPRLGFLDNFYCITESLLPLGIRPLHYDGVFWGQCLERVMMEQLNADWILTVDYDTVFTKKDVEALISLAARSDFADAIAAVQLKRKTHDVLIAIKAEDGKLAPELSIESFKPDLLECHVAHFGLTMFRTSALKKMEHPWFMNVPDENGEWGEKKQDEDIYFWRKWRATGNTLYLANHVPVGHIESMITWPDSNMDASYQHPCDFWGDGKPKDVWK